MREIFTKMLYHLEKKQDLMLAIIVDDSGSTPRGKGSMMLVGPEGYIIGSIGGGAVEDATMKRAMNCITNHCCDLHVYNLSERSQNSIGMVCGGEVTVYLQYIPHAEDMGHVLAAGVLEKLNAEESGFLRIDTNMNQIDVVDKPSGGINQYVDGIAMIPFDAEERAIVFGGGHIALELVPILKRIGFEVIVMDNREDYVTQKRFPKADQLIVGDYDNVANYIRFNGEEYIIIMTSGHTYDLEIQEQVLRNDFSYVGVVGSKKKTAAVNKKLREFGISDEMIEKVHTPIGLDIKAITPAEIAISIASELVLERANKRREKGIKIIKDCPMH